MVVLMDQSKAYEKHKAMSYGRMKEQEQKLTQEIEALLECAWVIDA
jgi:hypothetical protein